MEFSREISYSRNVFLPITNICRNHCAYCGFRREPGDDSWFMLPRDVMKLVKRAKISGCSEALLTLGELPEVHAEAREKLKVLGYTSTVEYLEDLCRQILKLGLLPHTNAGILKEAELHRLRPYNASMGLMLENVAKLSAHEQSPGKKPGERLETIKAAGKLKIPFTTGLLVGIGETFEDLVQSLHVIRDLQQQYGHIQEIIIQPFDPKPNTPMEDHSRPSETSLLKAVALARSLMPNMKLQVPPNLLSHNGGIVEQGSSKFENAVAAAITAGANDFGGISSVTPDFISEERPWPKVQELRNAIERVGFTPRERLPIYPQFIKVKRFMSKEVRQLVNTLADDNGYRSN